MTPSSVIVFGYGELGAAAATALRDAGARVLAIVVPGNRSGSDVDRMVACAAEQRLPLAFNRLDFSSVHAVLAGAG